MNCLSDEKKKQLIKQGWCVVCDNTNNTSEDIENNIIRVDWYELDYNMNNVKEEHNDFGFISEDFLNEDIEILIASLINSLWQDLTEEEKQQIKEILNG